MLSPQSRSRASAQTLGQWLLPAVGLCAIEKWRASTKCRHSCSKKTWILVLTRGGWDERQVHTSGETGAAISPG